MRPFGTVLIAVTLFVAGLTGAVGFRTVLPRTSDTSPLAALFALIWSCTYVVAAILTWRRSHFAAPVFVAAIGLLVFPAAVVVPGASSLRGSWPFVFSLSPATDISAGCVSSRLIQPVTDEVARPGRTASPPLRHSSYRREH